MPAFRSRFQVVLASVPDLSCGFARELFVAWAEDMRNSVIFTMRPCPGTLARTLIDNLQQKTVDIEVKALSSPCRQEYSARGRANGTAHLSQFKSMAAVEIWNWSLLGVKGLKTPRKIYFLTLRNVRQGASTGVRICKLTMIALIFISCYIKGAVRSWEPSTASLAHLCSGWR